MQPGNAADWTSIAHARHNTIAGVRTRAGVWTCLPGLAGRVGSRPASRDTRAGLPNAADQALPLALDAELEPDFELEVDVLVDVPLLLDVVLLPDAPDELAVAADPVLLVAALEELAPVVVAAADVPDASPAASSSAPTICVGHTASAGICALPAAMSAGTALSLFISSDTVTNS